MRKAFQTWVAQQMTERNGGTIPLVPPSNLGEVQRARLHFIEREREFDTARRKILMGFEDRLYEAVPSLLQRWKYQVKNVAKGRIVRTLLEDGRALWQCPLEKLAKFGFASAQDARHLFDHHLAPVWEELVEVHEKHHDAGKNGYYAEEFVASQPGEIREAQRRFAEQERELAEERRNVFGQFAQRLCAAVPPLLKQWEHEVRCNSAERLIKALLENGHALWRCPAHRLERFGYASLKDACRSFETHLAPAWKKWVDVRAEICKKTGPKEWRKEQELVVIFRAR